MKKTVTVQERVAELVAEFGTYRAASAHLGVDHAYLSRLGSGKICPSRASLRLLGLDLEGAVYKRLQTF